MNRVTTFFTSLFFLSLVFTCVCLLDPTLAQAETEQTQVGRWKQIAPDLEIYDLIGSRLSIFSSDLFVVRTSLKKIAVSAAVARDFGTVKASAEKFVDSTGALLAINANFFDPEGKALGLVVSRGIGRNQLHKGGRLLTGIFELSSKGPAIFSRDNYDQSRALEAIQAGPRLIVSGKPVDGLVQKDFVTKRAGVCLDSERRLIIFCSGAELGGVSLTELQGILRSSVIGCVDALNFDGGGSAQLYMKVVGKTGQTEYEKSLKGTDDVPVALLLKPIVTPITN